MEKFKRIFNAFALGLLGLTIGVIGAPFLAIVLVIYMTKVCAEWGYYGVESIDEMEKDMNKRLMEIDEDGE